MYLLPLPTYEEATSDDPEIEVVNISLALRETLHVLPAIDVITNRFSEETAGIFRALFPQEKGQFSFVATTAFASRGIEVTTIDKTLRVVTVPASLLAPVQTKDELAYLIAYAWITFTHKNLSQNADTVAFAAMARAGFNPEAAWSLYKRAQGVGVSGACVSIDVAASDCLRQAFASTIPSTNEETSILPRVFREVVAIEKVVKEGLNTRLNRKVIAKHPSAIRSITDIINYVSRGNLPTTDDPLHRIIFDIFFDWTYQFPVRNQLPPKMNFVWSEADDRLSVSKGFFSRVTLDINAGTKDSHKLAFRPAHLLEARYIIQSRTQLDPSIANHPDTEVFVLSHKNKVALALIVVLGTLEDGSLAAKVVGTSGTIGSYEEWSSEALRLVMAERGYTLYKAAYPWENDEAHRKGFKPHHDNIELRLEETGERLVEPFERDPKHPVDFTVGSVYRAQIANTEFADGWVDAMLSGVATSQAERQKYFPYLAKSETLRRFLTPAVYTNQDFYKLSTAWIGEPNTTKEFQEHIINYLLEAEAYDDLFQALKNLHVTRLEAIVGGWTKSTRNSQKVQAFVRSQIPFFKKKANLAKILSAAYDLSELGPKSAAIATPQVSSGSACGSEFSGENT